MNKLFRTLTLLTLLITSCVNPTQKATITQNQNIEDRSIAQSNEVSAELEYGKKLNLMINDTNIAESKITDDIDKLFVLLFFSYGYVDDFDKTLDELLVKKKQNNQTDNLDPLQSVAYSNLIKTWILKEKYEHQIVYFYESALKIRTSLAATDQQKKNARFITKTIDQYFNKAEVSQQLELQNLMSEIRSIYRAHVQNYKNLLRNTTQPRLIEVSGVSENVIFDKKIISNSKKLNQLYNESKSQEARKKSEYTDKYFRHISAIESELQQIQGPTFDQRTPNSLPPQVLSCSQGKKICISTGEEGNIVGKIFPQGVWAFTYDDGPASVTTGQIMDLHLNDKDKINPRGKATFFWRADYVEKHDSVVARALKNNFPIENHSYNHADLSKENYAGRVKQVITSNNIIENAIHKYEPDYKIRYFRCPYGSCFAPKIPEVRQMLVDQRQIHVYWRIDSLDWKLLNGPKVADLVIKQMQLLDHGVILMHDIHATTVDATKIILTWLKKQNDSGATKFKLVTIPEAVDLVNGK